MYSESEDDQEEGEGEGDEGGHNPSDNNIKTAHTTSVIPKPKKIPLYSPYPPTSSNTTDVKAPKLSPKKLSASTSSSVGNGTTSSSSSKMGRLDDFLSITKKKSATDSCASNAKPGRKGITAEELTYFDRICQDKTINNRQDPFIEIQRVVDVVCVHRKPISCAQNSTTINFHVDRITHQQVANAKTSGSGYKMHIQFFDFDLKPQSYPADTTLYINRFNLDLPKPYRKLDPNKPVKKELWNVCKCIDVSTFIKDSSNSIEVFVTNKYQSFEGVFVIAMTKELTAQQLIERVTFEPKIEPKAVDMQGDEDDLIECDDEMVTLRDPLTLARIKHPAKGQNCLHKYSCFDAESYLRYSRTATWNCAVCEKPLPFSQLVLSTTMAEILAGIQDEEITRILIHSDGSYDIPKSKENGNLGANPTPNDKSQSYNQSQISAITPKADEDITVFALDDEEISTMPVTNNNNNNNNNNNDNNNNSSMAMDTNADWSNDCIFDSSVSESDAEFDIGNLPVKNTAVDDGGLQAFAGIWYNPSATNPGAVSNSNSGRVTSVYDNHWDNNNNIDTNASSDNVPGTSWDDAICLDD